MNGIDKAKLSDQTKFRLDEIKKNWRFSLATGIVKKLLKTTRNKKKHDKIFMLAKSKLDSIETLVSQALIDMEINHAEVITILKEKDKYEKMKENVRNVSKKLEEKQENMKLNSVNSGKINS